MTLTFEEAQEIDLMMRRSEYPAPPPDPADRPDPDYEALIRWMVGQMDGREVECWHSRIARALEYRRSVRPEGRSARVAAAMRDFLRIAGWGYHVRP